MTNEYDGGPGSAFVGSEDVAQKFVGQGPYEDFYTKFEMSPEFEAEFDPFRRQYEGGPGIEYEIPYNIIDRFNELTVSRSRVVP